MVLPGPPSSVRSIWTLNFGASIPVVGATSSPSRMRELSMTSPTLFTARNRAAGRWLSRHNATIGKEDRHATHGVLSGPAIERLQKSVITRVVVTNTLPLAPEKQIDKIEVLSIAPLIADALSAVFDDTSVSEIFGGENQS